MEQSHVTAAHSHVAAPSGGMNQERPGRRLKGVEKTSQS